MKLGIQSCSFDLAGYGRWGQDTYKKLREHGYDCIDFNMADTETILYTASQEESDALLLREKEMAEAAGITIWQAHGPWRWFPQDSTEEERAERLDKMKKSIRGVSLLGCKNWIVHPIMPYGVQELNTPDADKTWSLNLAFMRELLVTAREYDVTICLENMPMLEFSMARPTEILRFVREIHDDHFKICLDTGHVSVFTDMTIADEVRRVAPELRTLHVHDNKYGRDAHMLPFIGITDWRAFANALHEIGFHGCISLETIPSAALPDDLFEDTCKLLARMGRRIADWAENGVKESI